MRYTFSITGNWPDQNVARNTSSAQAVPMGSSSLVRVLKQPGGKRATFSVNVGPTVDPVMVSSDNAGSFPSAYSKAGVLVSSSSHHARPTDDNLGQCFGIQDFHKSSHAA